MKIICKNCGWSWNRNDGGVNPCKCHKCGYNNKDMYGKKILGLGGVSGKGIYRWKNQEEEDNEYKSIFSWIGKWSKENKYDGNLKKHNKKFNKDYAKFLKSKKIPFMIREIKNGKKIPLHLREVETINSKITGLGSIK